jgi:hypothetical protein
MNMVKCGKCGVAMELKGELDDSSQVIQCPKCKNIELLEGYSSSWFSLDYP